jgi:antitoxin component YwqK of YwqJK toxin-antitoxin module
VQKLIEYYRNGFIMFKSNYDDGYLNRNEYYYWENGNKKKIIFIKNGKQIMSKKYDIDGKRIISKC